MDKLLVVILNGKTLIKYSRNQRLAGLQRRFLDKMDTDMDDGVKIAGQRISNPNKTQRVQYVANHLVNAVVADEQHKVTPACAYLAKTEPTLKRIQIDTTSAEHSFNLVFDNT